MLLNNSSVKLKLGLMGIKSLRWINLFKIICKYKESNAGSNKDVMLNILFEAEFIDFQYITEDKVFIFIVIQYVTKEKQEYMLLSPSE